MRGYLPANSDPRSAQSIYRPITGVSAVLTTASLAARTLFSNLFEVCGRGKRRKYPPEYKTGLSTTVPTVRHVAGFGSS